MREFGFELALCAHLERADRLVSRQLGAHVHGRRIVDTLVVDPGPGFEERAAITDETIPPAAIEAQVGPGQARPAPAVFDSRRPERVEALVDHAVDVGFFERERHNGRTYVRQVARYPDDWFGRLLGIENKPDLDRPGDLQRQLRTDVSLGLLDAVVLATESYVTRAHRNRFPPEVGIWRFDPATGEREVIREATPLDPDDAGVELLDQHPGRTEIEIATPAAKARARRRLAERAYGKGWRTYDLPPCAQCSPTETGLPHCGWHGRLVDPATECGETCPGFESEDPPSIDQDRLRAERSCWVADPAGHQREQADLRRFGE